MLCLALVLVSHHVDRGGVKLLTGRLGAPNGLLDRLCRPILRV